MTTVTLTRNGWASAPAARVAITAPGCADTGDVRAGDVATVFQHFATAFDAQVEPLVTINGYRTPTYNAQVGGDPASNHISATALDFNGARHPYERNLPVSQRGANYWHGFTPAQVTAIRVLLSRYGGVIAWGLDFNVGYRDAMHFEIRGTAADVARIAAKVKTPPTGDDDMPTPEEVAQAVWTMVLGPTGSTAAGPAWLHLIAARESAAGAAAAVGPMATTDPVMGPAPLATFVGDTRTDVMRVLDIARGQVAQVAALTAAVEALSVGQGVDPAVITAAAKAGAEAALAGLVLRAD